MSRRPSDPSGAHDYSSPQIRVRGASDFRRFSNERLRLPNERRPLGPRLRRLFGALIVLTLISGTGVGVYFGVSALLEDDETAASTAQEPETSQSGVAVDSQSEPAAAEAAQQEPAESEQQSTTAAPAQEQETQDAPQSEWSSDSNEAEPAAESEAGQPEQSATETSRTPPASVAPSVSDILVTPAQIGGAEISAERVTAEPIPAGIPRTLADGADYDPTETATAFTSRWPIGTTLRLTRLPGATLLSDDQQEAVIDTQVLVVVRASEASNTDLQLSPAAFDQIAFYGTERIITVRVEVTAPPP